MNTRTTWLLTGMLLLALLALSLILVACSGDDDDDDAADDDDDSGSDDDDAADDDDSGSDDDDATDDDDDTVPECTPAEICSRFIDDCEYEVDRTACEDFYGNPPYCADPAGFHDCNCACLHDITFEESGEATCDDFNNCTGKCTTTFCQ